jgi:hypothetical protein
MMKKVLYILLAITLVLLGVLFYNFVNNNCKNVNIRLNNDSRHEKIFIEMFWDNEKIFSDSLSRVKVFPESSFNTSFGKHSLKLVANGVIEKRSIFVFPMKFLAIDYYGKDFYEWEPKDNAFFITERLTPIMIE